jgi:hypothetical protein
MFDAYLRTNDVATQSARAATSGFRTTKPKLPPVPLRPSVPESTYTAYPPSRAVMTCSPASLMHFCAESVAFAFHSNCRHGRFRRSEVTRGRLWSARAAWVTGGRRASHKLYQVNRGRHSSGARKTPGRGCLYGTGRPSTCARDNPSSILGSSPAHCRTSPRSRHPGLRRRHLCRTVAAQRIGPCATIDYCVLIAATHSTRCSSNGRRDQ